MSRALAQVFLAGYASVLGCLGEIGEPSEVRRRPDPQAASGATGDGGNSEPSDAQSSGGGGPSGEEPPALVDARARDLSIREVALYQGVKIPIANGAVDIVDRNAPVVAARPGLLRVFVDIEKEFVSRTLVARLELSTPGRDAVTKETQLKVTASSRDDTPASTFNFALVAEDIAVDAEYAVSLFEVHGIASPGSTERTPRSPESGFSPLGARSFGTPFRVVVVPVRYNADGSGRTPSVDASAAQSLQTYLFRLFPTSALEVTVHTPITFAGRVSSGGSGWSSLLDACLAQRSADGVDPRTYYYCMFNPALNFSSYCDNGCVTGLGPVPGPRDGFSRGAIGLGFGDAAETMAHELGHTLGRPHAPCGGVASPDPYFPYAGGEIGAWGYDLDSSELLDPSTHSDLMGYCDGPWISDYNYNLIFGRFQSVLAAPRISGQTRGMLSIVVDADQTLSLGHLLSLAEVPGSAAVSARYLDAGGSVLAEVEGGFSQASHANGGVLYLPAPGPGAASIEIEGFGQLAL